MVVYDLVFSIVFLLAIPYLLVRMAFEQRYRMGAGQRLGMFPAVLRQRFKGSELWIHAASVGEVMAAAAIVRRLRARYPELHLVLSTLTSAGNEVARKLFPQEAVIFFPLDLSAIVSRVLDMVRPQAIVLIETEIWPNFISAASRRGIPVLLLNGRISSSSYRLYGKVRFFIRRVLRRIAYFNMQTEGDAERIKSLGANPMQVQVGGNVKFDGPQEGPDDDEVRDLVASLRLTTKEDILVAGSTHDGEEEILLQVCAEVRKKFPRLLLILAPRHLERLAKIEQLLSAVGERSVRRTALTASAGHRPQTILMDTMGELARVYALAKLVFVGGSLVPVGGHNLLEPAACGKPVLFGPYVDNFKEVAQALVQRDAAIQVSSARDLQDQVARLLSDPELRQAIGSRAREVVTSNQGAAEANAEIIGKYLERQA